MSLSPGRATCVGGHGARQRDAQHYPGAGRVLVQVADERFRHVENVRTYVSIPSVQEVLVLQSASIAADLRRRRADGMWPKEPTQVGRDEMLHLESIGLRCPLTQYYVGTYLARQT